MHRFFLLVILLTGGFVARADVAALRVVELRTELDRNPAGIDVPAPRLSWQVASPARGARQTRWQIIASSTAEALARDQADLWDSGEVISDQTTFVTYAGKPLVSSQQVFWKVRSWDQTGQPTAWSEPAQWTMGLRAPSDWKGVWIAAPAATESLLLRGEFTVRTGLKRAIVHATGLGQYELYFNGTKAGDDLLTPGWTNYNTTVLYDTRDVTGLLRPGANAAGFLLGNGFYNIEHRDRFTKLTGSFGPLKAILHLQLEYADGSVEYVGTGTHWLVHSGPITVGHIFAGEDYDARLAPTGWAEPGFAATGWSHAVALIRPVGTLVGHSAGSEPLRVIAVHPVVGSKKFSDGTVVYDFGQNASHMPRLRVTGPAGSIVRLTPAEVVNEDGTINRNTMDGKNRGNAWWQFTKATDREEIFFPKFYYVGCRYLKVETFHSEAELPVTVPAEDSTHRAPPASAPRPGDPATLPVVQSLELAVVHAATQPLGQFETSSPLLNQIRDLVRWAQRSNMVSVLTDCPHREKLGWIEQYHLNGPAIRYEFDVSRIFTKGMHDMADGQTPEGLVPNIAPEFTVFKGNFRSAAEWGAAFLLVPWQQREFTGDDALLRRHYEAMTRYFSYLESRALDDVLSDGLGDWFDLGPQKSTGPAQLTPAPVTASAFLYYDATLLARAATLLGKEDDARKYAARADQLRTHYNARFFHPETGSYATGSQCANALALVTGLVPEAERPRVFAALVRDVEQHEGSMTTGDIGFRFLLRALADGGRSDLVLRMITQTGKPGYAYQLKQGATSLTESWDASLNASHNHFMLGQVTEWFYHDLAGIAADPESPGFKHVIIRPQPVDDVAWVAASHDSLHGKIAVRWERRAGQFLLNVTIPPNTTATVHLPASDGAKVLESGLPAGTQPGVKLQRGEPGHVIFNLESGSYSFATAR